ncbi:unnamed protein product [Pedinophyceae sp. YPF-701]|nr:unnamed protein product [Pedinophyceae sp. YPF-701]
MASEYLKDTVGDILARGLAATCRTVPSDPVEYLAYWLRQYADNVREMSQYEGEKAADRHAKEKQAEADAEAKAREAARAASLNADLELLANMNDNTWGAWQAAVDVITRFTSANSVYVANVSEEEVPDPELPPAEELPPDVPEDGADDPDVPFAEPEPEIPEEEEEGEEGEGEEAKAEGDEDGEKEEGDGGAAGEEEGELADEDIELPGPRPFDYSKAFLEYVVASAGEDWVSRYKVMQRPSAQDAEAAAAEGEAAGQDPKPMMFRMLDDKLTSLYLPDVMLKRDEVQFFNKFPRVGAFLARSLLSHENEVKAILCVDTVKPPGHGNPLSAEERDVIERAAAAVEAAMVSMAKEAKRATLARAPYAARVELQAMLRELAAPTPPPEEEEPEEEKPPKGKPAPKSKTENAVEKEASAAGSGDAEEEEPDSDADVPEEADDTEPPVVEEPAAAEAEGGEGAGEGEGGEEGDAAEGEGEPKEEGEGEGGDAEAAPAEEPPEDPAAVQARKEAEVDVLEKKLMRLRWEERQERRKRVAARAELKAQSAVVAEKQKGADKRMQLLRLVQDAVRGQEAAAMRDLRTLCRSPPTTFRVLRAVMVLLKKGNKAFNTWTNFKKGLSQNLLDEIVDYDPEAYAKLETEELQRIWGYIKGLNTEEGLKLLEEECPRSSFGAFLLVFLYHCRKTSVALRALHAEEAVEREKEAAMDACTVLVEGKKEACRDMEADLQAKRDELTAAIAAAAEASAHGAE